MNEIFSAIKETLPYIVVYVIIAISSFASFVGFLSALLHGKDIFDYRKVKSSSSSSVSEETLERKKHLASIAPAKIRKMLAIGVCSAVLLAISVDWKEEMRQNDFIGFSERNEAEVSSIISEHAGSQQILVEIPNEDSFYVIKPDADGAYHATERGSRFFSRVMSAWMVILWLVLIVLGAIIKFVPISFMDYYRVFCPKKEKK